MSSCECTVTELSRVFRKCVLSFNPSLTTSEYVIWLDSGGTLSPPSFSYLILSLKTGITFSLFSLYISTLYVYRAEEEGEV